MNTVAYGMGAYTLSEAGRLLGSGVGPKTLRRWIHGYEYDHHGPQANQPPLWRSQYESVADEPALIGFRDLIEARIVRRLRQLGIGLQTIRVCMARAREIIGDDHPFSSSGFRSDGKRIFLEITDNVDEPKLVDLRHRQMVFRKIVEPTFIDLDFNDEAAIRWWLLPHKRTIVIDPTVAFGQPTIAGYGTRTSTIADAMRAEESIDKVARLYEIDRKLVRDAVAFESRNSATATA